MSPSNTALLLAAMVACLASSIEAKDDSLSGRSARWDQEMSQLRRQKRQTRCGTVWYNDCSEIPKPQLTAQDVKQYRNMGWLADIGNQGKCGSCWAFAAAHAVTDSQNIGAMTKQDNLLSSQYTTRCAARPVTNGYGCCGGHARDALELYQNVGVPQDRCLPFDEKSSLLPWYVFFFLEDPYKSQFSLPCLNKCKNGSPFDPLYQLHDFRCYEPDNALIQKALDRGHVVITSMRVNKQLKQLYKCGIFCEEEQGSIRHAAVIVDYGPKDDDDETTSTPFWVVKNSWGPNWGESGYFRVRRGQGDLGIGSHRDFKICVPLLAPDPMMPPSNADFEQTPASCSAIEMSEPMTDPTVMSALEFGLEKSVERGEIECPDGTNATDLTLIEFEDATVQSVAGTVVELTIEANVEGCECDVTKMIELTVFIDFDGTFTLTSVTAGAEVLQVSAMLLLVTVAIGLLNAY